MIPPSGSVTKDGWELQWGTNVLGHFVLTQSLLPLLKSTSQLRSKPSRVVNISSMTNYHTRKVGVDFDRLSKDTGSASSYLGRWFDYGRSKLGVLLVTREMSIRYGKDGILVFAVHPGIIVSNLQQHNFFLGKFGFEIFSHPVKKGALTQLYAATCEELVQADAGTFFVPWARRANLELSHARAHDDDLAKRTWDWCEAAGR